MSEVWKPKTVAALLEELSCYPSDAIVKSYKAVVDTGRMQSTVSYSQVHAKKLHAMRLARHD